MIFAQRIVVGSTGLVLLVASGMPAGGVPAYPAAQSFSPQLGVSLSNESAGAHATLTLTTNFPGSNHLLGHAFFSVPKGWGVATGGTVADGDLVGSVSLATDRDCNGSIDPAVTASLIDAPHLDDHAHWNAYLGSPLNLTLQFLVDVNLDDPDVDYDISVAVFPNNPSAACAPLDLTATINGVSGLGTNVLTNPNNGQTYTWQAIYLSSPVALLEHMVGRAARVCIADPDADNDGVCDAEDNCPSSANPEQGDVNANGNGDACDLSDSDGDGFSDRVEYRVGTSPAMRCGPLTWPPDSNNDTFADVTDLSTVTASFGLSVPPAPARNNIAPDPVDAFVDITDVSRITSLFGSTCAPCPNDLDCDAVYNAADNCPNWPNPAQQLPPWPVIAGDPDCDGFVTAVETSAGTSPLAHCGTDSWPADVNNDRFSDVSDVSALTANFGVTTPPAPARQDIAPDPVDGFVDITDVSKMTQFFGLTCS